MLIATLITCYNRRRTTLACLDALFRQTLPSDTDVHVYLVDDGCTDGTGDAVRQGFPQVRLIAGDGTLYWGGGMRLAWSRAVAAGDYGGYLWLNDDTMLFPAAISTLVRSCQEAAAAGHSGIIVGSTCDPDDGRLTYGGQRGASLMEPPMKMQACDTMCGNIVLVPRAAFRAVGNLTADMRHYGGDQDYGLRARKAGFAVWLAPGFLGQCRRNPCPSWADPTVPFRRRWRGLHSPKGQPMRETYIFCKRHYGWQGLISIPKLYLRVLFPGPWNWLKRITGRW